jgi:protein SCO1/2
MTPRRILRHFYAIAILFAMPMFVVSTPATSLVPQELKDVGIQEKLGQQVDLNLKFRDESGATVALRDVVNGRKPTLLFLVYYSCPSLCNFFLNGSLDVLKQVKMTAGNEFNILTVSIDPREESDVASKKKQSYLDVYNRAGAAQGWRFWVNETTVKDVPKEMTTAEVPNEGAGLTSVRALAHQVGFRYRFDPTDEQFAHAAAMVVLTPEGRISRYLYGINFDPRDLRLAVVEAAGGKIGNIVDRLLLFCYHYDPKSRRYALFANNLMRVGAVVTVLLLGVWIAMMFSRNSDNAPVARRNVSDSKS